MVLHLKGDALRRGAEPLPVMAVDSNKQQLAQCEATPI